MWTIFGMFVLVALVLDFYALNRQGAHRVSMREAGVWSAVWVAVAALFAGSPFSPRVVGAEPGDATVARSSEITSPG